MAVKVHLSLDAVRVFRTVGIGDIEMLKWNKTDVQSWEKTGVYVSAELFDDLSPQRRFLDSDHT